MVNAEAESRGTEAAVGEFRNGSSHRCGDQGTLHFSRKVMFELRPAGGVGACQVKGQRGRGEGCGERGCMQAQRQVERDVVRNWIRSRGNRAPCEGGVDAP